MNLFYNLKDTLASVRNDLTSGFHSKSLMVKSDDKVLGHELIIRYAQCWKEICLNTDSLSKQADVCDKLMANLSNKVASKKSVFNQVTSEFQSLGKVVTDVEAIQAQIDSITKCCGRLEEMLTEIEGLNRRCQHLALVEHMEKKFNEHCQKRIREHDISMRILAEQHKGNLERLQRHLSEKRLERQKVFDEVHREEMDNYRMSGKIHHDEKIDTYVSPTISAQDISEINFNDEAGLLELEAFLDSEFEALHAEDTTMAQRPDVDGSDDDSSLPCPDNQLNGLQLNQDVCESCQRKTTQKS